jgi:hypothetical protein
MQVLFEVEAHAKGKSEVIPDANKPAGYYLDIFVDFFESGLYIIIVAGLDLSGVCSLFKGRHD